MQFITYFSASIISYLGLLIGIILIKIAPEEQKPLHRHFTILRYLLLFLIFLFAAFYYSNNIFFLFILVAYFLLIIFIEHKLNDMAKKSMIISGSLGAVFHLSSVNPNLFVIESSLLLLYGIPTASLIYKIRERNHYKLLLYNSAFLFVANLLYFT